MHFGTDNSAKNIPLDKPNVHSCINITLSSSAFYNGVNHYALSTADVKCQTPNDLHIMKLIIFNQNFNGISFGVQCESIRFVYTFGFSYSKLFGNIAFFSQLSAPH